MKQKIVRGFIIFIVFLTVIMAGLCIMVSKRTSESETTGYELVDLNEIEQLHIKNNTADFQNAVDELREIIRTHNNDEQNSRLIKLIIAIYISFIFAGAVLFLYVYFKIIHPFEKMKTYAMEIAQGNMEATLNIERENYFGDFTWAFDHMRNEIIRARRSEKEAVDNNKTVIATLSHDIKTPIASIRAYCEALEANMDQNVERRQRYTSVIMKKCDEVARLTNDLFIHSIADMNKLTFIEESVDITGVISEVASDAGLGNNAIKINNMVQGVKAAGDKKRIAQVFENIFSNAGKYAPGSPIDISSDIIDDMIVCSVRDHGHGIPPEDIPFITEKFYRGKNAGEQPGSGLGLYIVSYIMEHMNGNVQIMSHNDGLEIKLFFKIIS